MAERTPRRDSETPFADFLGGKDEFRRAIADWRHAVTQVLSQYRGATGDYRGGVQRAVHDFRANPRAGGPTLPTFPTFPGLPPFPLGATQPPPGTPPPVTQPPPVTPPPATQPPPVTPPVASIPSPLVSPYPRGHPLFNPWWADLISKGPRLKPYPAGVVPNRQR